MCIIFGRIKLLMIKHILAYLCSSYLDGSIKSAFIMLVFTCSYNFLLTYLFILFIPNSYNINPNDQISLLYLISLFIANYGLI
jgi:hypothetical protein